MAHYLLAKVNNYSIRLFPFESLWFKSFIYFKKKISFNKYQEKNSTLSHDDYIQKIADKLEDKYHSIKNELGYEFLIYKEIKLIKILDKSNNYIIINSQQNMQRPLNNKDIN